MEFQKEFPGAQSAWWLPSFTLSGGAVPELQEKLREKGVPTRRLFSPLHTYPYLKDSCRFSYPHAERIFEQGINIPASTVNDEESTLRAAEIIRDAVLSMRR